MTGSHAQYQLSLGLSVAPFERCVSMSRTEIFIPAWMPLPEILKQVFGDRLIDLDAPCNTVSIYAVELARDLNKEERHALSHVNSFGVHSITLRR